MMNWAFFLLYIVPLILASIMLGGLTHFIWRHRTTPGAVSLLILSLAAAIWSLGYALELLTARSPIAIVLAKLQYVGIVALPVAWLIFAVLYSGHSRRLNRATIALLSVIPLITLGLVWTNEYHHLIWPSITLDESGPIPMLRFEHGVGFWVCNLYSHLCLLAGSFLLFREFLGSPRLFLRQIVSLVVAIAAPWLGNILYVTHLVPVALDFTPFAFTLAALTVTLGIWRYHFLKIVPIAREHLVEHMRECILVLDMQGRIIDCNPAVLEFMGTDAARLIGEPAAQSLARWPALAAQAQASTDQHAEVTLRDARATQTLKLSVTQLYDRRRHVSGRLMVWHDITALKQTEAALRLQNAELVRLQEALLRAKDAAEAANRAKSTFLANMSHELRTPLTAILGYAQLMHLSVDGAGDPTLARDLAAIESSSLHLLKLINNVLDLAKLEAGKTELYVERLVISDLIALVATTIRPLIAKNHNRFVVEHAEDCDHMVGDETKIYQVLLNLLGNAAKFTEHGTITLRVQRDLHVDQLPVPDLRAAAVPPPMSEWIRFEIVDSGIGIAPDRLSSLFGEFTQADSAIAQQYGGTGLGLKLSQHLCQLMGGDISVTSELNRGSTFVVQLPMVIATRSTAIAA